jgi:WD40 repeat protein
VRLWQQSKHKEGTWRCAVILEDTHVKSIRCCCWSPCGTHLATASFDGATAIWAVQQGVWEEVSRTRGTAWRRRAPNRRAQPAAGAVGHTLTMWWCARQCHRDAPPPKKSENIPHTAQVCKLEGHENEVKCVAWSPCGNHIATCGRDRTVWFWERGVGEEYDVMDVKHGHSQDVKCVAWHPARELLASASYDDSVRLWVCDEGDWTCAVVLEGACACASGRRVRARTARQ